MNWKVVKNRDLLMSEGLRIANLKDQYWPYGLESQILWMKNNIGIDDVHLMGEEKVGDKIVLKAYITLVNLNIMIDDQCVECIGVGGVCIDKAMRNMGMGRLLMYTAERYISGEKKEGILLCKDTLVPFYEKCGWKLMKYQNATVAGNNYMHNIMLLNKECACMNIIIEKNF